MADQSDLVLVINRAALIENILNQVIEEFCEPRQEPFRFFWNVILDSSIMPMGSKVKVAAAIAHELKFNLKLDALHKVIALRNAFAHHNTTANPLLQVGRTDDESKIYHLLQVISRSGKLQRMDRKFALAEFNKHFLLARDSLVALKTAITEARAARLHSS